MDDGERAAFKESMRAKLAEVMGVEEVDEDLAESCGRAELEETKPVWADFYKVGRRASPSFQRWSIEHERA